MKIMIHTCNQREWYVYDYLIPSLYKQGIRKKDIEVWHDYKRLGNLGSFIGSMDWISYNLDQKDGTWHIQDDICVSKNFKRAIEENDAGVVCGFVCSKFNGRELDKCGIQPPAAFWYSFPCIRIPNSYCKQFVNWIYDQAVQDNKLYEIYKRGKDDDLLFRQFLMRKHSRQRLVNLNPNIVQHVDWLIGGSQVNQSRSGYRRSFYWGENDVVEELEERLRNDGKLNQGYVRLSENSAG